MKTKKFKVGKITSEGGPLGTNEWVIQINGIKDEDLYNVEVAVLNLFGRKKKKSKI